MLDIKFIRENADLIKEAARKKHSDFKVADLLELDQNRLKLLSEVEKMRAEQNRVSEELPGADTKRRTTLIESMRTLKASMQEDEGKLAGVTKDWQRLMLSVPNVPDVSVPEGASDADNQEVRTWGEPTKFDFKPKSHIELMQDLDLADFDRGTKIAGFRGYVLKKDAALLNFALWQLVINHFLKNGYELLSVPSLVKRETLLGTGYLPQGEEDLYKTQDGDYLAGTAEVATMAYFMDEVLPVENLPKKFLAFSPCFRREAGSHGKDTKGLVRVHEFYKWEQVILCEADHSTSVKYHEEIARLSEEIWQMLKIPYHVVANCGGDLGLGQVKKYDIEAWVPSENTYRETHSASYFHDFQTRRLNIRYKDKDGKMRFAHSLNNTALATPRALVPILENYQQADGNIKVPEALQAYMGKKLITK
jgi:seryl-tRNA synthetase